MVKWEMNSEATFDSREAVPRAKSKRAQLDPDFIRSWQQGDPTMAAFPQSFELPCFLLRNELVNSRFKVRDVLYWSKIDIGLTEAKSGQCITNLVQSLVAGLVVAQLALCIMVLPVKFLLSNLT